jgi:cold shock protein
MQGKVVFFQSQKGWGFLRSEQDGKDYFVHHTAIVADGYRDLKKDQRVSFDVEKGPKDRLQATNVTVIS